MQLKRPRPSASLAKTSSIASIAGTLITLSTSLLAEPLARLTPAELAEMDKLTIPMSQQIKLSQAEVTRTLESDATLSSNADKAMAPFLNNIGQGALLVQTTAPSSPKPVTPPVITPKPTDPKKDSHTGTKKKDPKKSTQTTLKVECDGGLYFDSDTGVLAYLKNIRLTEPRFALTCSDELKVFLEQKPKKPGTPATKNTGKSTTAKVIKANQPTDKTALTPPAKPPKTEPAAKTAPKKKGKDTKTKDKDKGLGSFNGLKRIIAIGNVKVTQKDENGKLFIASAATASYNGKTGEMILRGGRPRLQQSANQYLQAEAPGQYIRIQKNGKLVTSHGKWTMLMTTQKPVSKKPTPKKPTP